VVAAAPDAATFAVAPPPSTPAVPTAQAPTSCGQDQIRETICGAIRGATTCGPTGESLDAYGKSRVVITQPGWGGKDPLLRGFLYDDDATHKWAQGAGNEVACCYTQCTPVPVFASAPVPRAKKGTYIQDRCIPPPAAGTSAPAKAEPRCPAAVELEGQRTPLKVAQTWPAQGQPWWYADANLACCYPLVHVQEPPAGGGCKYCKCAAQGTHVATPDGERAIETLQVGDRVLSMHHGRLQPVAIARVSRTPAEHHVVVEVQLDNGRTVVMSPLHPTATGSRIGELERGDHLGDATVLSTVRVPYTASFTYDILPASDTGTYVAEGALVGSTLAP
jgi:hypothetical protein